MFARSCGDCTLCCTSILKSSDSLTNAKCEHVCMTGCAIYTNRPDACASYTCGWLDGLLKEEHRPDKTGIVFEYSILRGTGGEVGVLMGLVIKKLLVHPNVFQKYVRDGLVITIVHLKKSKRYVLGKQKDIKLWKQYMESIRQQGGIDIVFTNRIKV